MIKTIAYWVWRNEWIPLGPLSPCVLGLALGSTGQRVYDGDK